MDARKTGSLIAGLRKEKQMTQKDIALQLHVSEQAVSKWERGAGSPDISMVGELAQLLGVSPREILSGVMTSNEEDSGNMKKTKFYVCPECNNIVTSTQKVELTCCGKVLLELEARNETDQDHHPTLMQEDGEIYLHLEHEMSKEHYISFIAYVTCDKLYINKLYPEQNCEVRFAKRGHGMIYLYCSKHGLKSMRI